MNKRTLAIPAIAAVLLAGCATTYSSGQDWSYGSSGVAAAPQPAPPRVYSYPLREQSAQQQDRDRYECFNWASVQTGFDPSRQPLPAPVRQAAVPARPSGAGMLTGAIAGALIGAAVSNPWHQGEGAIIGAVAGTALGAAADSAQASAAQSAANTRRSSSAVSAYEGQATEFRRAMSACLEGRGYAVK